MSVGAIHKKGSKCSHSDSGLSWWAYQWCTWAAQIQEDVSQRRLWTETLLAWGPKWVHSDTSQINFLLSICMEFPEAHMLRNSLNSHCPDVVKIQAKKKEIFKVACLSCDSTAFCQTNKLVLLEAQEWAKALGGLALKETLGRIQTNLDREKDIEFSIRMKLFTNSREVNFDRKNMQEL